MMHVVTLNNETFAKACRKLEAQIRASNFEPDIVVGIATGGTFVALQILEDVPHANVVAGRPSTRTKRRHSRAMNILRRLPHAVTNILRIMESYVLRHSKKTHIVEVSMPADVSFAAFNRILVVDDAVDSGATLRAVLDRIKEEAPAAHVRSAVVTVTTPNPSVMPEYTLYNNSTLIRFPWSMDSK